MTLFAVWVRGSVFDVVNRKHLAATRTATTLVAVGAAAVTQSATLRRTPSATVPQAARL
jgi:hypothetical protein